MENLSVDRLVRNNPELLYNNNGMLDLGLNFDSIELSHYTQGIVQGFDTLYSTTKKKRKFNRGTLYFIGGDPLEYRPFDLCKSYLTDAINYSGLYNYQSAKGNDIIRGNILSYLIKEKFCSEDASIDNIAMSISTTNAFKLILEAIAKPHDVVLFTAPTYGLFSLMPDRDGIKSEYIELEKESNWIVDPAKLDAKIKQINSELSNKYPNLDYTPRVVAFFNQNPCNPTGKVMSNIEQVKKIGNVCKSNGTFVIDDLIYRDLGYDRQNMAIPMGGIEELFDNTITITGLSKAYGLPAVRAGLIIANDKVIRLIQDRICFSMDSLPYLQQKALEGAFNTTDLRNEKYNEYFSALMKEYKIRLELLKALVSGVESVEEKYQKVIRDILNEHGISNYKGSDSISFVKGTMAESGFFSLLDFSNLLHLKNEDNEYIETDLDLFNYLRTEAGVKVLPGRSVAMPNFETNLVARVTTALDYDSLIEGMLSVESAVRKLK